jgi:copper chaperone CopZ
MGERTFRVDQIHCEGCTAAIREALGRLEGVEKVEPDGATHTVRVAFAESRVDEPTIAARLAEAGFPAKEPVSDREPAGKPDGGSRWWALYGVLTVAIVLVALAGYVGYELYPRFDLPAAGGVGLLALARVRVSHRSSRRARSRFWSRCCRDRWARRDAAVAVRVVGGHWSSRWRSPAARSPSSS